MIPAGTLHITTAGFRVVHGRGQGPAAKSHTNGGASTLPVENHTSSAVTKDAKAKANHKKCRAAMGASKPA